MTNEIRNTFTDPTALAGDEPEAYFFTVRSSVFPELAATVSREAIEDFACGRGDLTDPDGREAHLHLLRTFQPEFVALAVEKSGGRERVTITAADVAELQR